MHLILFLIAIVLAFAGFMLIFNAVPVIDVPAAALFTSGVVALVGGFVLAALAAAVRSLARIAERMEIQPLPLPPTAAVGREDPGPRAVRAPKSTAPAEPKRGSLLSWFGRASKAVNEPAPPPESEAPREPAAPAAPSVDLAPLTRVPDEPRPAPVLPPSAPPPPPLLKPVAPPLRPPAKVTPPAVAPAPAAPPPAAAPAAPAAAADAAPAAESPATTVYKSGVIEGMAYTLFMDGAIEAELPQGKVRFATIDELQKYLTTRQP